MIVLADLEAEIKARTRVLGASTSTDSVNRMRYAIRKGGKRLWDRQDWDFKNSAATIATTDGNLGGYDAPSGLVRLATSQNISYFQFRDAEVLVPVYKDDPYTIPNQRPYIRIQDGKIYFVDNPGSGNLTLNYTGSFGNSIEIEALTAEVAQLPKGLTDALVGLVIADLFEDLPGMADEAEIKARRALSLADEYWDDVTRDRYQKTIAPKGLNKVPVDNYARVITVLAYYNSPVWERIR